MKSVKKFSAMSVKDQPITESAKVSKEAVDELIKKIGFNSIEELKNEKDLLSKLEALSKSFAASNDISEEDIEEDRTEDIEDETNAKGEPKSAEGSTPKTGDDDAVSAKVEVEEDATEEADDDLVSDEQEITKEVPAEADEVEDEDGVDIASEEEETPKATRRIMAFEDFIKEKETTINKNVNYHDDDEEPEDYAVPMAASANPLAESDESRGEDDELEEEDAEKNESAIMSFSNFVNEAYDKVVWGGNKGDDSVEDIEDEINAKGKPKSVKEAFTFADAVDTAGEDVKKNEKGIASALKALKARTASDISIMTDTTEDDGLFDAIKGMKELSVNSSIYDNAYAGKYKGKDVVVFNDGDDLFAYVKEGVGEVITKIEGDEIADEVAGADGIAIPAMKGDGSETAAGIAGDIMNKGKVKNMSSLDGKLVTPDQTITKVIPDEANDVSEDGIEIPLVKEAKINEEDITSDDQFKEYAMKMLKDAFGDDFDEAKATDVADGLIKKYAGDYGAMVGALQSTMGS